MVYTYLKKIQINKNKIKNAKENARNVGKAKSEAKTDKIQ